MSYADKLDRLAAQIEALEKPSEVLDVEVELVIADGKPITFAQVRAFTATAETRARTAETLRHVAETQRAAEQGFAETQNPTGDA